jgi:Holliday junction resolvasome RuvABC ATP-dependent DNA helicase subunit
MEGKDTITNNLNRSVVMLGFLINQKERKELEYLIKREMDEILFDLKDERIDHVVKRSMKERYKILFSLFKRVASPAECMKYMVTDNKVSRKSY